MGKPSHRWGTPSSRIERGYGTAHDRIRRAMLREVWIGVEKGPR